MVTKIYVAVNGTCTAGPDDDLFDLLDKMALGERKREFSKTLNRQVTGGGTSLWVRSDSGIYVLDTGDEADRGLLEESLSKIAKEEKIDPAKSVRSVYNTHSHPDHNANHDLFKNAYWMVEQKDKVAQEMLSSDSANSKDFRKFYDGHRKRGITYDKFTLYTNDNHYGKPDTLTIIDAPGHEKSNKAFAIEDDEVIVMNLETNEEHKTKKVVLTGDSICDERYLTRFTNADPAIKKTAVYGTKIPTEKYFATKDPVERNTLEQQNLNSIGKILDKAEGGVMIFSHGGLLYNCGNR